jgi:hypothetical protein
VQLLAVAVTWMFPFTFARTTDVAVTARLSARMIRVRSRLVLVSMSTSIEVVGTVEHAADTSAAKAGAVCATSPVSSAKRTMGIAAVATADRVGIGVFCMALPLVASGLSLASGSSRF